MSGSSDMLVKLSQDNYGFLCELYKKMASIKPGENIFFSPFSISTALSMTLAGARQETESQLRKTLGFADLEQPLLHSAFKDLLKTVISSDVGSSVDIANGVFIPKDFPVCSPFMETLQDSYSAMSKNVDFAGDPKGALSLINSWVNNATREKISEIIEDVDPLTAMIIVNAIYFKSFWNDKFDSGNTEEAPFHLNKNESLQIKLMFISKKFRYATNEAANCEILELPYQDKKTSMVVFLPRETDGLSKIESMLSPSFLQESLSNLRGAREFEVYLPSFKLEESYSLGELLKPMGIQDLFKPEIANLSGISETSHLYVSKVVHKSFVEVNEEGTEAAAVTAVQFKLLCMRIKHTFRADHPFLFCIVHNTTSNILFIGSLKKPKALS